MTPPPEASASGGVLCILWNFPNENAFTYSHHTYDIGIPT